MSKIIRPIKRINGKLTLPGDEFCSHLSLILASLCRGQSLIENLSPSKDCRITLGALKKLGISIQVESNRANVQGKGLNGLVVPKEAIDFADSKMSFYLLAGIFSGQEKESRLRGDSYLLDGFRRNLAPSLEKMGVEVTFSKRSPVVSLENKGLKSLSFHPNQEDPLARASLELASLFVEGYTNFIQSENEDQIGEKLLRLFGADLDVVSDHVQNSSEVIDFRKKRKPKDQKGSFRLTIQGKKDLNPQNINLPRDALLAIFFAALAIFTKKSQVELEGVDAEGSHFKVLQLLKNMGAEILLKKTESGNLSTARIIPSSSETKGRKIDLSQLDQVLPMLAVIAALSQQTTIIRGLSKSRQGKTNKLKIVSDNLRKMGAKLGELGDGLVIEGRGILNGAQLDGKGDFSISLGLLLASLLAEEESELEGYQKVLDFYPNLFELLNSVCEHYK